MRQLSPAEQTDPKQLQEHSKLIAGTLALKPNDDCIELPDQQYTCLTQSGNQALLDDGHGQTIIDALTGNEGAGLIGRLQPRNSREAASTRLTSAPLSIWFTSWDRCTPRNISTSPPSRFRNSSRSICALTSPPSFHNPKSVIVIGLPSVQQTTPPPLRAADAKLVSCLQKPGVVLQVEGAPLVFSTGFAHDLVLHLNYPAGAKPDPAQPQDIPLTVDAFRGGLVLAPIPKRRALPTPS